MPAYNYINETGVITIDTASIQLQVQSEYKTIFGSDLVVTPNTPQGMLIAAESLARIALAENNAKLANQINPNLAGGVFLDAIIALTNPYGRLAAFQSIVFATLNGVPGTVIPAGSIASETGSGDSNQFFTLIDNTIPDSGSLPHVQFNSVVYGPIPCALGTLTNIVTAVLGWETITSSTAAVLGRLTQSDLDARLYRLNTLATQGASCAQAITSEILRTTDATSLSFLENTAATTQTIDGVSMVAHSIYTCVNGTGIGTYSTVIGTLTGTPTTVISAGSEASSNGNVFKTLTSVTIPASGSIDVLFQALSSGVIVCPPASLTTIVTPISGWASVTNAFDTSNTQTVVIGTITGTSSTVIPSGSQASSNGFIYQTLASVTIPSGGSIQTTFQCLTSGFISCPVGSLNTIVTPVSGWTSVTNANPGTSTGIVSTIAQALVAKKSAGAAYNNGPGTNISAQVVVPYSNQIMTVLFDTPTPITIVVLVNIKILTSVQNATTAVQNAIVTYANGQLDGIAGLTVGQNVSAFELAGAITSQHPGIYVQSLYISISPTSPTTSTEIEITPYQIAQISTGNIIVNVVS